MFDNVNIHKDGRLKQVYANFNREKHLKKKLKLCDNYSKAYLFFCDYYNLNPYQEVAWDVNVIYGKNGLREFSLNDFDYVNIKYF